MTNPLSLNTNLLNGINYPKGNNLNFTSNTNKQTETGNSLFGPLKSNNFYSDDFMMSGFDFNSLSYDANTGTIMQKKTVPNPQDQQSLALQDNTGLNTPLNQQQFTGVSQAAAGQQQGLNFNELNNYLVREDDNKQNKPSNIGKIAGTTIGLLAPVGERVAAGMKSGGILKAMNWKQLAVTCPIIGLAGFGIGFIADKIINSFKGSKSAQINNNAVNPQSAAVPPTEVTVPLQLQYQPLNVAA